MDQLKQVARASSTTEFAWGAMSAEVALFKTTAESKLAEFDTLREPAEEEAPTDLSGLLTASLPSDPLAEAAAPTIAPVAEGAEFGGVMPPPKPKPRKGIYRADGTFIDLTEKLEAIDEATQLEEMRVVSFIRREVVPRERIIGSYYVAAKSKPAAKILRLLRDAMAHAERVAVVRWTKRSRQALGVIVPRRGGAIEILELEWARNWREPNPRCLMHAAAPVTPQELTLAAELVHAMGDNRSSLDDLEDDRIVMRENLRHAAEEGLLDSWDAPSAPEREETADVLAGLEESLSS